MREQPGPWMSRSFLLIWQGQIVSQIGTQVFMVTLALWLRRATDSATLMGLLMMAGTLPAVLLGPLGGALVDRYSRLAVLVTGDLTRGLAVIAVALTLFFRPDSVHAAVAALFVASVVGGVAVAAWQPAAASLLPDLVPKERLASANSLIQASFQLCGLLALGLAGIMFRVFGAPLLALFDGLSYLYAAASESLARVPARTPNASAPRRASAVKAEILEGLQYIRAQAGLRMLVYTMTFMRFFLVPMAVLFPFYVDEHLVAGPEWYGFLLAASGLGTFVGYAAAAVVKLKRSDAAWAIVTLLILISAALGSLGLVFSPWVALWIVFGIGGMSGFVNVKLTTILQLATPAAVRGRVFGVLATITGGLAPVAMGLTGVVTDLTGRNIPLVYLACGAITAALSVGVAARRECRAFLAGEAPVLPAPTPAAEVPAAKPA
jgi:DHA3 family macrolide efflux protein-like MFS transporter